MYIVDNHIFNSINDAYDYLINEAPFSFIISAITGEIIEIA